MREVLRNSLEEIKRVDHLIYVSLKYTRTVDVIKSVMQRMLDSMDFLIQANLMACKSCDDADFPKMPTEKVRLLKTLHPQNEQLHKYLDFYTKIRKILRAKYTASQEFRRHVTMSVVFDNPDENLDVNIDVINEYYLLLKEFFDYTYEVIDNAEKNEKATADKKKKK
ncbi:MAG: hypothetical protein WC471_00210 [Candidatus Woesearchaeota archaeon]